MPGSSPTPSDFAFLLHAGRQTKSRAGTAGRCGARLGTLRSRTRDRAARPAFTLQRCAPRSDIASLRIEHSLFYIYTQAYTYIFFCLFLERGGQRCSGMAEPRPCISSGGTKPGAGSCQPFAAGGCALPPPSAEPRRSSNKSRRAAAAGRAKGAGGSVIPKGRGGQKGAGAKVHRGPRWGARWGRGWQCARGLPAWFGASQPRGGTEEGEGGDASPGSHFPTLSSTIRPDPRRKHAPRHPEAQLRPFGRKR